LATLHMLLVSESGSKKMSSVSREKQADCWQREHRWVVYYICLAQPHWKRDCRMQFKSMAPGAEVFVGSVVTLKSWW